MARRPQLTEAQRAALFDPPSSRRDIVRHYTFSPGDLAEIRRCHAAQLQERLKLRPYSVRRSGVVAARLLSTALVSDRLYVLAEAAVEELRRQHVILPSPDMVERPR